MKDAIYNTIGKTYDVTRKADPAIVKKLIELLQPELYKKYLDLGCGSGNYTHALAVEGVNIEGIDISVEMIAKAKHKDPQIKFYVGDARKLPFKNDDFFGAICVLATHHIGDYAQAFKEVYRVMHQGRIVIFTATRQQMQNYWLWHYFPKMMQDTTQRMASFEEMEYSLKQAGFNNILTSPFFISNQSQDCFLHAGKYRPEIYLDPAVRQGISSFHLSVDEDELNKGLKILETDIKSGAINKIIERYENDGGDYSFIAAEKSR